MAYLKVAGGSEENQSAGFYDCFILLQWKDEANNLRETWEFIQTLVDLMDPDHAMSLLGLWSVIAERRHEDLFYIT
ncbi:hypothetical protein DM02DRAFT_662593 [Periconia macrospinosa]|uniref:Uncharacterized protein n=1 Tax=Periconia macrospinosa TaxID=97972 RepID=A0A2V1D471_9PLEO|nr:hypothetical protein DM02DRAFT_662593 [Periconia macrospinosa]